MVLPAVRGPPFSRQQLADEHLSRICAPTLVLVHPGDIDHPIRSADFLNQRLRRCQVRFARGADTAKVMDQL